MTSEKAYRIVLAGDAAVGKSSFLLRLCKNEFKLNSSATLGESEPNLEFLRIPLPIKAFLRPHGSLLMG